MLPKPKAVKLKKAGPKINNTIQAMDALEAFNLKKNRSTDGGLLDIKTQLNNLLSTRTNQRIQSIKDTYAKKLQ